MVPVSVCSGVIELPTGVPTGARPVGAANGDRTPTAEVGAPTNLPGTGAGAGDAGVGCGAPCAAPCAGDTEGTDATMTAPTVPAMPSIASRLVIFDWVDVERGFRGDTSGSSRILRTRPQFGGTSCTARANPGSQKCTFMAESGQESLGLELIAQSTSY